MSHLIVVKNKLIPSHLAPCQGATKMKIDIIEWWKNEQDLTSFYREGRDHALPNQYSGNKDLLTTLQRQNYRYYHSRIVEKDYWLIILERMDELAEILKEHNSACHKIFFKEKHEYPVLHLNHGPY